MDERLTEYNYAFQRILNENIILLLTFNHINCPDIENDEQNNFLYSLLI